MNEPYTYTKKERRCSLTDETQFPFEKKFKKVTFNENEKVSV